MATQLRWLPGLLLVHSAFFLVCQTTGLTLDHPVVLLPGSACSQIEVRLTDAYQPPSPLCAAHKGDGKWHRLWKSTAAPPDDTDAAACIADQLRLVYDDAAGDYRNPPGVETRTVSFGSTRGFLADDPADKELCMGTLVEALERAGYRDGETLFGAPYDFRHGPAPPGKANRELSRFRRRLRGLVERASRTNGGKPVTLVSHSMGGYFALDFLRRSPLPWRRRFVKHFVMASTGAGGFVLLMQTLSSRMTYPGTFTALPSPVAFGDDVALSVTENRSYAARDMPAFIAAAGLTPLDVQLYETRALPVALSLGPPLVPMTCVNGVGVPTVEKLVYPGHGGVKVAPEVVYGDGDGVVNLASIMALDTVMGGDPRQEYYKSIRIANMSHRGVVSDPLALDRLLDEILYPATPAVDTRAAM